MSPGRIGSQGEGITMAFLSADDEGSPPRPSGPGNPIWRGVMLLRLAGVAVVLLFGYFAWWQGAVALALIGIGYLVWRRGRNGTTGPMPE
jgi:hypothetical protein